MGRKMIIPSTRHPILRVMWDLRQLLSSFRFWLFLAWLDVRQQYRRSTLGPFWITLTTAGYVLALIVVFGSLFRVHLQEYAPWVTIGVISWNLISACLSDSGNVLLMKKQLLLQRQISHNGLILSSILKWTIVFFTIHTAWILVTVPALILLLQPLCLIVAYMSMRLRDVPPLVVAVLTPLFFVTPIMWSPDQLGDKAWIAAWNPFAAMVGLVREPMLGHPIPYSMIVISLATGVVLWGLSFLIQVLFRKRIMYWA